MSNDKSAKFIHTAATFLGKGEEALTPRERAVVEKAVHRRTLARDPSAAFDEKLSLGDKRPFRRR